MTAIPSAPAGKVLLIDDDDLIAGSLRQYLALQGCDVDVALEQGIATELMRAHEYGVVVVDPYLTGALHMEQSALLDSIAHFQPSASVIVVTGYGSAELARRARDSRIALLNKPQSVVALTDAIFGSLRQTPRLPVRERDL